MPLNDTPSQAALVAYMYMYMYVGTENTRPDHWSAQVQILSSRAAQCTCIYFHCSCSSLSPSLPPSHVMFLPVSPLSRCSPEWWASPQLLWQHYLPIRVGFFYVASVALEAEFVVWLQPWHQQSASLLVMTNTKQSNIVYMFAYFVVTLRTILFKCQQSNIVYMFAHFVSFFILPPLFAFNWPSWAAREA